MTPPETQHCAVHRIPRHTHAWAWLLLASQLVVAVLWWQCGWRIGLPVMLASHLVFWWGVLVPQSPLFSPVLVRLPTQE